MHFVRVSNGVWDDGVLVQTEGFVLSVSGFNHKLHLLLSSIVKIIFALEVCVLCRLPLLWPVLAILLQLVMQKRGYAVVLCGLNGIVLPPLLPSRRVAACCPSPVFGQPV